LYSLCNRVMCSKRETEEPNDKRTTKHTQNAVHPHKVLGNYQWRKHDDDYWAIQHRLWSRSPRPSQIMLLHCTTFVLLLLLLLLLLLWQFIVVFGIDLQGISPTTVRQPPKFLVASICDLPDVTNSQFRGFVVVPLGLCIFCRRTNSLEFTSRSSAIQLLTPNSLGETWRRSLSVRRTFEALR